MTSRNILNIALLGIVIVLVLVVVFEPGKETAPVKAKLTSLDKNTVNKIELKRRDKQDVVLEKVNGVWYMTAPYQLPANDFRTDSILRLLEADSHSQHDLQGLDTAKYKLDKPEVVVTFNDQLSIKFGATEPLNHRRYVQVENTLHVVTDTVYYHVSGRATGLLSMQLLPKDARIQSIQLPGRKLELQEGKWQISPEPEAMASDAVTQLLNEWRHIQALDVSEAKDKATAEKIAIMLEQQEKPIVFSIIRRKPDLVLLREDKGVQYSLTEDSAERLLQLAKPEAESDTEQKSESASKSE